MKSYRLACLTSHPIQYQAPMFRRLATYPKIDLTVYFMSDLSVQGYHDQELDVYLKWDVPLLDGYKHVFLPCLGKTNEVSVWNLHPTIVTELWRNRYDAILVHGYTTATAWLAFIGACLTRTPIIFRGEADLLLPRSRGKQALKGLVLARLFKRINAFLFSYGGNADYYRYYSVPEEKLFSCPCAVDNAFWQEQATNLQGAKPRLKRAIGVPSESPAILFVGKLILRKRPLGLIRAFEGISNKTGAWLVFVGDGPLKAELVQYVREHGLRRVIFLGFKNQSEIAPFYAMADIFVLSSNHDPSPKVLNEAMNFSLPVISTNRVGTATDLVKPGENGFVYPVGDIGALRSCLSALLESSQLRQQMGRRSLEIVSEWSYEKDVEGILAALEYVRKNRVEAFDHA